MVRSLDVVKQELLQIGDPVRKRAFFVAMLSEEMIAKGVMAPIVVGGEAVEFYTQGAYTTAVFDVANKIKGIDMDYIRKRARAADVMNELNMLFSGSDDN